MQGQIKLLLFNTVYDLPHQGIMVVRAFETVPFAIFGTALQKDAPYSVFYPHGQPVCPCGWLQGNSSKSR